MKQKGNQSMWMKDVFSHEGPYQPQHPQKRLNQSHSVAPRRHIDPITAQPTPISNKPEAKMSPARPVHVRKGSLPSHAKIVLQQDMKVKEDSPRVDPNIEHQ